MVKFQKYTEIFSLSVIQGFKNYKSLIGLSIFLITCLLIFAHLWKVVAAKTGVVDLNADQLLWYIALNEWILISLPDVQDDMEEDLRSGRLAYLLPRPISYLSATFFEGLGTLCVNLLVLGVVTFTFTWIKIGSIPFTPSTFSVTIALGFLAGCVGLLFQMLIGLSAFWLQQVSPFLWLWDKLLLTLGGLMLPLSVYPIWLQKIANLTPFPFILGERSALVMHFNWQNVLSVTFILLFWGFAGLGFLIFLYRRGLRIVNVEGG